MRDVYIPRRSDSSRYHKDIMTLSTILLFLPVVANTAVLTYDVPSVAPSTASGPLSAAPVGLS